MSHAYVAVQWSRKKVIYDLTVWGGIALYVVIFVGITNATHVGDEALSPMIVLMRAFATLAFVMITMILCIGPLCRLDRRFLPLLYNRRHFGVSMFVVTLVHAVLAIIWYHSFGVVSLLESLFSSPGSFTSFADVPYQPIGAVALLILLLLAATSHDFWNTNLGPAVWKALHMLVYVAYALIVVHVASGAMQRADTGVAPWFVLGSVVVVATLHLAAAWASREPRSHANDDNWIDAGRWDDITDGAGKVLDVPGAERIAVFRYDGYTFAATGNVCRHQGGPLAEGRVIDGCITCPWHGFQYRPEDGCSPPPFTEKIETYPIRIVDDRVHVDPNPLPPGTARDVAVVPEGART